MFLRIEPDDRPQDLSTRKSSTALDEFHRLDKIIADVAKSINGYLGEEAWEDTRTGLVANVYYWQTRQALQELMDHPEHVEAKRRQAQWLNGYQVVMAQVLACHGDGRIAHPLGSRNMRGEHGRPAPPMASGRCRGSRFSVQRGFARTGLAS